MTADFVVAVPAVITVKPWRDPVVEAHGFPVGSPYLETAWLATLGPSATLALRRLGLLATAQPGGFTVELGELAGDLGLARGTGKQSVIVRTLRRLEIFGMARWVGDELQVRTAVAQLPARHERRLSPAAVAMHRRMISLRARC